MAVINGEQLKRDISAENFSCVYLIVGEDDFYRHRYARLIAKKAVSGALEKMNLSEIDGKIVTLQMLADETEQLPVMAEKRCVVITDYDIASKGKQELDDFAEIIANLPKTTVLILLYDTISINLKRPEKFGALIKLCDKYGSVVNCEYLRDGDIIRNLTAFASRNNTRLERTAASYLISVCTKDMNRLVSELRKLCAYKKGLDITKQDIDLLCTKSADAKAYNLPGEVLALNVEKAFGLLDELYDMGLEAQQINYALIAGFVDVYRAKCAISDGLDPIEIADSFGYAKTRRFVLSKAAPYAKRLSFSVLRACLDILADADETFKSKPIDPRIVLEKTIIMLVETMRGKE